MRFEKDGIIHITTNPIVADALRTSGYVEVSAEISKNIENVETDNKKVNKRKATN